MSMPNGQQSKAQQSKAQRRTAAKESAAQRQAATRRRSRRRMSIQLGVVVVAVGVIALIVVLVTGGSPSVQNPHVATVAIPASLHTVPPPHTTPGPETVPLAVGPKLATLATAATGQTIQGVQCSNGEQFVTHQHTHLTIFVNGKARVIPYGIGIPGFSGTTDTPDGAFFANEGSCFYWLHTHAEDGIIHIESPSTTTTFTLGQFFAEWGVPLSSTQVGPASGVVTAFFDGRLYKGDPAKLPLGPHYQIQLDVGTPIVAPVHITNWGDL
jgi:hypothetical protein